MNISIWSKYDQDLNNRLKHFNNIIEQHNPNIICLQEIFTYRSTIIDKLLNGWFKLLNLKGYNIANSKCGLFMNSGLITFSKFPIITHKFHNFNNNIGLLSTIRPFGFQEIEISFNNKLLNIFNTHLVPDEGCLFNNNKKIKNIRQLQFNEIKNYIKSKIIKDWIIVGDMNDNRNLYITNKKYTNKSCYIPNIETVHSEKPLKTKHNNDKFVDHTYTNLSIKNKQVIMNSNISDHYPIFIELL